MDRRRRRGTASRDQSRIYRNRNGAIFESVGIEREKSPSRSKDQDAVRSEPIGIAAHPVEKIDVAKTRNGSAAARSEKRGRIARAILEVAVADHLVGSILDTTDRASRARVQAISRPVTEAAA